MADYDEPHVVHQPSHNCIVDAQLTSSQYEAPESLSLLSPPTQHRHSAPSLLRGRWRSRRRASSPESQTTLVKPVKIKGPAGLSTLHEPSEPRVDFIFIHGLQGDSRKSWCHDSVDPSSFWPLEWLPYEAGFRHVRIHSFGYDSQWTSTGKSALTIHDFAQALLTDMSNSPSLRRNGDTPIIFVTHSMGGLIAKKAYLLGSRDPSHQRIASRIHTFYFLGTPHRGSNSAIFLDYYLKLSHPTGSKEYAKELLPNSATVQSINDEFRHIDQNIQLWSFYETVPTSGQIIVPKTSAVLGLPREQVRYLQADHRNLCKFDNPTNSNFVTLYRCFLVTIQDIEKDYALRYAEQHKSEMKILADYFDVSERPTKDLLTQMHKRHAGSCEWLTSHHEFQEWLDYEVKDASELDPLQSTPTTNHPKLFWLNGPPGSGKSVAAGHVISHLEAHNEDCTFFFFKNNAKATVTHLLRNLAFQMAWTNFEIRQAFISMIANGDGANTQDHAVIWNNIFLGRIFKINFSKPQFWVIDALDECPTKSLTAFMQMLAKVTSVPLRIFGTSRPSTHLSLLLTRERISHVELHTGREGSLNDISAFLRSRPRLWEADDEGEIVSEIVKKSKGVFLWASLIIDRLDDLFSVEDMREELKRIPQEMNSLYTRILEEIEQSSSAGLAKCIIKWVVCAAEPLTTEAIKEALKLDIGRTLLPSQSDKVFSQICKNLIAVDDESRVQVMHQTVKDFLSSSESEFYVNLRKEHESIATICLKHLNERRFDSRASSRALVPSNPAGAAFNNYVDMNFSYHLTHSHSVDPQLFLQLIKFMNSTILTWVERVSTKKKLSPFIKTIEHLKPYLTRQLERSPPFDQNYLKAVEWVNDLTRLVTIFGPYLIEMPWSIRTLVPPLCPTSSMIYQTFAGRCRPKLFCSSNSKWDERLSCLLLSAPARSVTSNTQYLAIGLSNGKITVFNNSTLEAITTLTHGPSRQSVQRLTLGSITNILASCGPRTLTLWKLPSEKIWTVPLKQEVKSICFSADDSKLYVTIKGNVSEAIMTLSASNGSQIKPLPIVEDSSDSDHGPLDWTGAHKRYIPTLIRISPVLGFAAVAYRSTHLTIFSLDSEDNMDQICRFKKTGCESLVLPPQVLDVAFNPAVESDLMAVSYQDGDIVTVEIGGWGNTYQRDVYHLYATVLASSPDGRTLAAGDNEGGICLFNFDNLRLLHRIDYLDEVVTGIIFASNSLRFYDIRGSTCNIWEPAVLIRKNSVDDSSSDPDESTVATLKPPDILFTRPFDNTRTITVTAQVDEDGFIFCGREDGTVTVHDVANGSQVFTLQPHSVDVIHLDWQPQENILISVDTSGQCVAHRLSRSPWKKLEQVLSHRAKAAVIQTLTKQNALAILITTQYGEELWANETVTASNESTEGDKWVLHPTDPGRLLLFQGDKAHLYNWTGLARESGDAGITLALPTSMPHLSIPVNWYSQRNIKTLVQAIPSSSETGFMRLDTTEIQPPTTIVSLSGTIKKLLARVRIILGIYKSNMFFLSTLGWICSIKLDVNADTKYYTRHFFVPPLWRTGREPTIRMIPGKSPRIVLAYRDELLVFHRFLDVENKMQFEQNN